MGALPSSAHLNQTLTLEPIIKGISPQKSLFFLEVEPCYQSPTLIDYKPKKKFEMNPLFWGFYLYAPIIFVAF
jgi:hypothetical protein